MRETKRGKKKRGSLSACVWNGKLILTLVERSFYCRLMLVVDISCDVNGSVEFLERTTNIDNNHYQYDPIVKSEVSGTISSEGVTVMGVDILPTELPRESSIFFGDALLPVLEKLIDSKTAQHESARQVQAEMVSASEVVVLLAGIAVTHYELSLSLSLFTRPMHVLQRMGR